MQHIKRNGAAVWAATTLLNPDALWACPRCRPLVDAGIYNASFNGNLLLVLTPVALLTAIGVALHFSDALIDQFKAARKGTA